MHGQHSCIVVSQEIFIFEQISLKKLFLAKISNFFVNLNFQVNYKSRMLKKVIKENMNVWQLMMLEVNTLILHNYMLEVRIFTKNFVKSYDIFQGLNTFFSTVWKCKSVTQILRETNFKDFQRYKNCHFSTFRGFEV